MKALVQNGYGTDFKSLLSLSTDFKKPVPNGSTEILVRVTKAASNPVDYKMTKGNLSAVLKMDMPFPVGRDFAGVVAEIPSAVAGKTTLKVGDRVCGLLVPTGYKSRGTFAEYVAIQPDHCAKIPSDNITDEEAAAIPLVGNTTWQALVEFGKMTRGGGQKVLVLGGSTATGLLALQQCRDFGCSEIVCTSSSEALCKSHGATEVFNYKTAEKKWEEALKDKKFDIVYDCVGGYDHWTGACKVMKASGARYVTIVGDAPDVKFGIGKALNVATALTSRKFFSWFGYPEYHMRIGLDNAANKGMSYFLDLLSGSSTSTSEKRTAGLSIVDGNVKVFPFSNEGVLAMWEKQASGTCKGKLIMDVSGGSSQ